MQKLKVLLENNTLSMQGPKHKESISISSRYPWDDFSETLFSSLGTMHMVAPYLPKTIETNFTIPRPVQDLVRAMYLFEKGGKPKFVTSAGSKSLKSSNKPNGRVAIAYSAGKDSMWNLWWAIEKYGPDNVLVVHIRNLNRNNGSNEVKHVLNQQKQFCFKHLEVIELKNGSLNTGYATMRSRDMFLAGVVIPVALEFGASKIITEGFADTKPTEPFTGHESNMRYFNQILRELKIPVQVTWRNRDEMLTIKDLYKNRPEWMPHVCNCFCIPCYQNFFKRAWQKRSPFFPLYESQCGACVKCRITNIARILYDPTIQKVKQEDVRAFLKNTDAWIRSKRHGLSYMIEGPFMRDFATACKRYDVPARSLNGVANA